MPFECMAEDCPGRVNSDTDIEFMKTKDPAEYQEYEIRCRHCGQKHAFALNRGVLEILFRINKPLR